MSITPEQAALKHHFLYPLVVNAYYADPEMQVRYDLARLELS
jgi:hypothetical protein